MNVNRDSVMLVKAVRSENHINKLRQHLSQITPNKTDGNIRNK